MCVVRVRDSVSSEDRRRLTSWVPFFSFFSQVRLMLRKLCRMYESSHGTIRWIGACTAE